jgi:hypothetical protein
MSSSKVSYLLELVNELKNLFSRWVADIIMRYIYINYDLSMLAYRTIKNKPFMINSDKELITFYKEYAFLETRKWTIDKASNVIASGLYNQARLGDVVYRLPLEQQWKYVDDTLPIIKSELIKHLSTFENLFYPQYFRPKPITWIEFCKNIKQTIKQVSYFYPEIIFVGKRGKQINYIKKFKNITEKANIIEIIANIKYGFFYWGKMGDRVADAFEQTYEKLNHLEFTINSNWPVSVESTVKLGNQYGEHCMDIRMSIKRVN